MENRRDVERTHFLMAQSTKVNLKTIYSMEKVSIINYVSLLTLTTKEKQNYLQVKPTKDHSKKEENMVLENSKKLMVIITLESLPTIHSMVKESTRGLAKIYLKANSKMENPSPITN